MRAPRPWQLLLRDVLFMLVVIRALLMEVPLTLIQAPLLLPWRLLVEPSLELPR